MDTVYNWLYRAMWGRPSPEEATANGWDQAVLDQFWPARNPLQTLLDDLLGNPLGKPTGWSISWQLVVAVVLGVVLVYWLLHSDL